MTPDPDLALSILKKLVAVEGGFVSAGANAGMDDDGEPTPAAASITVDATTYEATHEEAALIVRLCDGTPRRG